MSLTLLGGGSTCPAYLASAVILANGTTLRLTFSAIVFPNEPTVTLTGLTGGATTIQSLTGGGSTIINCTLSRTVAGTETGGLTGYSGGGISTTSNGLVVPPYFAFHVTNSSTQ